METKIKHLSMHDFYDNTVVLNFTDSAYDSKTGRTFLYDNDVLVTTVWGGIQFNGVDYYINDKFTLKKYLIKEMQNPECFFNSIFTFFIYLLFCIAAVMFLVYMYRQYL
jgi:hypothetical protein